jgi:hypothetical protein
MGFRLTPRDAEIIKLINDCQTLTVRQLVTWRFNSENPAYARISQLIKAGYLKVEFIPQIAATPIAATRILTITELGAAVLVQTYQYDETQLNYASPALKNWKSLQTILATNDFRVSLLRAIRNNPLYELLEWRNEAVFRGNPIYVYTKDHTTQKRKPVYPDGFFVLKNDRLRGFYFLEADNGTETYNQFRSQLEIYQAYIHSGQHEEIFGSKTMTILIVTTTEARSKKLQQLTAQVGGSTLYKFTTYSQATPERILSEPIWQRIGESQPSYLLEKRSRPE